MKSAKWITNLMKPKSEPVPKLTLDVTLAVEATTYREGHEKIKSPLTGTSPIQSSSLSDEESSGLQKSGESTPFTSTFSSPINSFPLSDGDSTNTYWTKGTNMRSKSPENLAPINTSSDPYPDNFGDRGLNSSDGAESPTSPVSPRANNLASLPSPLADSFNKRRHSVTRAVVRSPSLIYHRLSRSSNTPLPCVRRATTREMLDMNTPEEIDEIKRRASGSKHLAKIVSKLDEINTELKENPHKRAKKNLTNSDTEDKLAKLDLELEEKLKKEIARIMEGRDTSIVDEKAKPFEIKQRLSDKTKKITPPHESTFDDTTDATKLAEPATVENTQNTDNLQEPEKFLHIANPSTDEDLQANRLIAEEIKLRKLVSLTTEGAQIDEVLAKVNPIDLPMEDHRRAVLVAVANSPVVTVAQLKQVAEHADVNAATLEAILSHIDDLLNENHRRDLLLAIVGNRNVPAGQLNTVLVKVNRALFRKEENRKTICVALRDNPNADSTLHNSLQPMGIYADGTGALNKAERHFSGVVHKTLKVVTKCTTKIENVNLEYFSAADYAKLLNHYAGRVVSQQAQVATLGTEIYGKVIGRNDMGDYLIEIPTSTRVKFQLIPREVMGLKQLQLNAKVHFKVGEEALSHSRVRTSSRG